MSFLSRFAIESRDRVLYSPRLRRLLAKTLLLRSPRVRSHSSIADIVESMRSLCRLARSERPGRIQKVERLIRVRVSSTLGKRVDWHSAVEDWKPDRIEKAVILKPRVGEREKGVVFVSFEYQWARLMGISDLLDFTRRYTLVIAPSWSPPHALETTLFCAHYPANPIFSLISNPADVATLPRLSEKIHVVPLYASSWVNPEIYRPVPSEEKDIDIVMVAGFGAYKRHFALFRALRDLPRGLRVVLVGQPLTGRSAAVLMQEARRYNVHDRFELRESVSDEVVCQTLARAKVSVILSRHEGSCVAVAESILANTPVGIYEDAVIGSRVFINERTGRFLQHRGLATQLSDFLAASGTYAPRKWALENGVCCHGSTRVLNQVLKDAAIAAGEEWTTDIAVHHWRPDPRLLFAEDRERLRSSYDEIRLRYGLTLGPLLPGFS